MTPQYTLLGADGQPTPPVDLITLQTWVNAGRVFREQKVLRSDLKEWFKAGDFVELTWPTGTAGADVGSVQPEPKFTPRTATHPDPIVPNAEDLGAAAAAASWLWTVAALSAVNFLSAALRLGIYFPVGASLAYRFGVDAHGGGEPPETVVVGWVLGLLFLGAWVLLGYFCRQLHLWAFATALILLAGDSILCVLEQDWLSIAFHAWVLWKLVGGLVGAFHLRKAIRR